MRAHTLSENLSYLYVRVRAADRTSRNVPIDYRSGGDMLKMELGVSQG
jgi:hypothetical protein